MCVMTPGPLLVQQHVRFAGGNAEVVPVALLVQVAARIGLGIELLLAPPRRTSPTRMVEVARMERPSCGLARSSKRPAWTEASIPKPSSSRIIRFIYGLAKETASYRRHIGEILG